MLLRTWLVSEVYVRLMNRLLELFERLHLWLIGERLVVPWGSVVGFCAWAGETTFSGKSAMSRFVGWRRE